MDQKQNGNGWKWVAGGLALICSYQLGYSAGTDDSAPPQFQPTLASGTSDPAPEVVLPASSPASLETVASAPDAEAEASNSLQEAATEIAPAGQEAPASGALGPTSPDSFDRDDESESEEASQRFASQEDVEERANAFAASLAPATRTPSTTGPVPSTPLSTTPAPSRPISVGCAENGSCYGDISTATGRPKTVRVRGYYRKDGTYVRGHYRSR